MTYKPLTQVAQDKIRGSLRNGDWAIDATAGNGHDTAFLAQEVGPNGAVYAFDVQTRAIESTLLRLTQANLSKRVTICQISHADMLNRVPHAWLGNVAAITFNLGYLPNSDKSVITHINSTLPALENSLSLLKTAGTLSILVYQGHAGGSAEATAVTEWLAHKKPWLDCEMIQSNGPTLYACRKISATAMP